MKCEKCGSEGWDVVDAPASLETWRCKSCGFEAHVHVHYDEPLGQLPKDPAGAAFGRWLSRPSLDDARIVQRLFPHLSGVGPASLMRKGFEGKEIELGIYNEHELLSMKTELESIGFKVRIDQYKPPDGA